MTKEEFDFRLDAVRALILSRDENNVAYNVFFKYAKKRKRNGEWYIQPVMFEKFRTDKVFGQAAKSDDSISLLARRMNDHLKDPEFCYKDEILITQSAHFIYLIIGREEIKKYSATREQMRLGISLGDVSSNKDFCPKFCCGVPITLTINPHHEKGWLYLFHIDSRLKIRSLSPGRYNTPSLLKLPARESFNYSNYINIQREKDGYGKWRFDGDKRGRERVFAMLVDDAEPVAISEEYLQEFFSYPLLFACREIPKGMSVPSKKAKNIRDIDSNKIAIGTLDYFYEG